MALSSSPRLVQGEDGWNHSDGPVTCASPPLPFSSSPNWHPISPLESPLRDDAGTYATRMAPEASPPLHHPNSANPPVKKDGAEAGGVEVFFAASVLTNWQGGRYTTVRELGSGSFGVVYLCIDHGASGAESEEKEQKSNAAPRPAGPEKGGVRYVALKVIDLQRLSSKEAALAMNEAAILRTIRHPHILTCYDTFYEPLSRDAMKPDAACGVAEGKEECGAAEESPGALCIVTEYCEGGDLASYTRSMDCKTTHRETLGTQKKTMSQRAGEGLASVLLPSVQDAERLNSLLVLHQDTIAKGSKDAPSIPRKTCGGETKDEAEKTIAHPLLVDEEDENWGDPPATASKQTSPSSSNLHGSGVGPRRVLESFRVMDIARQCLDALSYLHNLGVMHRDIKPSNIYLCKGKDEDGNEAEGFTTIKLGDFGVSRLVDPVEPFANTFIGTPFYMPPELCLGERYSFSGDVWALGVTLYEVFTSVLPFRAGNVLAQLHVITEGEFDASKLEESHTFPPEQLQALEKLYGGNFLQQERQLQHVLARMIREILSPDPETRPSAEALLHMYFAIRPSVVLNDAEARSLTTSLMMRMSKEASASLGQRNHSSAGAARVPPLLFAGPSVVPPSPSIPASRSTSAVLHGIVASTSPPTGAGSSTSWAVPSWLCGGDPTPPQGGWISVLEKKPRPEKGIGRARRLVRRPRNGKRQRGGTPPPDPESRHHHHHGDEERMSGAPPAPLLPLQVKRVRSTRRRPGELGMIHGTVSPHRTTAGIQTVVNSTAMPSSSVPSAGGGGAARRKKRRKKRSPGIAPQPVHSDDAGEDAKQSEKEQKREGLRDGVTGQHLEGAPELKTSTTSACGPPPPPKDDKGATTTKPKPLLHPRSKREREDVTDEVRDILPQQSFLNENAAVSGLPSTPRHVLLTESEEQTPDGGSTAKNEDERRHRTSTGLSPSASSGVPQISSIPLEDGAVLATPVKPLPGGLVNELVVLPSPHPGSIGRCPVDAGGQPQLNNPRRSQATSRPPLNPISAALAASEGLEGSPVKKRVNDPEFRLRVQRLPTEDLKNDGTGGSESPATTSNAEQLHIKGPGGSASNFQPHGGRSTSHSSLVEVNEESNSLILEVTPSFTRNRPTPLRNIRRNNTSGPPKRKSVPKPHQPSVSHLAVQGKGMGVFPAPRTEANANTAMDGGLNERLDDFISHVPWVLHPEAFSAMPLMDGQDQVLVVQEEEGLSNSAPQRAAAPGQSTSKPAVGLLGVAECRDSTLRPGRMDDPPSLPPPTLYSSHGSHSPLQQVKSAVGRADSRRSVLEAERVPSSSHAPREVSPPSGVLLVHSAEGGEGFSPLHHAKSRSARKVELPPPEEDRGVAEDADRGSSFRRLKGAPGCGSLTSLSMSCVSGLGLNRPPTGKEQGTTRYGHPSSPFKVNNSSCCAAGGEVYHSFSVTETTQSHQPLRSNTNSTKSGKELLSASPVADLPNFPLPLPPQHSSISSNAPSYGEPDRPTPAIAAVFPSPITDIKAGVAPSRSSSVAPSPELSMRHSSPSSEQQPRPVSQGANAQRSAVGHRSMNSSYGPLRVLTPCSRVGSNPQWCAGWRSRSVSNTYLSPVNAAVSPLSQRLQRQLQEEEKKAAAGGPSPEPGSHVVDLPAASSALQDPASADGRVEPLLSASPLVAGGESTLANELSAPPRYPRPCHRPLAESLTQHTATSFSFSSILQDSYSIPTTSHPSANENLNTAEKVREKSKTNMRRHIKKNSLSYPSQSLAKEAPLDLLPKKAAEQQVLSMPEVTEAGAEWVEEYVEALPCGAHSASGNAAWIRLHPHSSQNLFEPAAVGDLCPQQEEEASLSATLRRQEKKFGSSGVRGSPFPTSILKRESHSFYQKTDAENRLRSVEQALSEPCVSQVRLGSSRAFRTPGSSRPALFATGAGAGSESSFLNSVNPETSLGLQGHSEKKIVLLESVTTDKKQARDTIAATSSRGREELPGSGADTTTDSKGLLASPPKAGPSQDSSLLGTPSACLVLQDVVVDSARGAAAKKDPSDKQGCAESEEETTQRAVALRAAIAHTQAILQAAAAASDSPSALLALHRRAETGGSAASAAAPPNASEGSKTLQLPRRASKTQLQCASDLSSSVLQVMLREKMVRYHLKRQQQMQAAKERQALFDQERVMLQAELQRIYERQYAKTSGAIADVAPTDPSVMRDHDDDDEEDYEEDYEDEEYDEEEDDWTDEDEATEDLDDSVCMEGLVGHEEELVSASPPGRTLFATQAPDAPLLPREGETEPVVEVGSPILPAVRVDPPPEPDQGKTLTVSATTATPDVNPVGNTVLVPSSPAPEVSDLAITTASSLNDTRSTNKESRSYLSLSSTGSTSARHLRRRHPGLKDDDNGGPPSSAPPAGVLQPHFDSPVKHHSITLFAMERESKKGKEDRTPSGGLREEVCTTEEAPRQGKKTVSKRKTLITESSPKTGGGPEPPPTSKSRPSVESSASQRQPPVSASTTTSTSMRSKGPSARLMEHTTRQLERELTAAGSTIKEFVCSGAAQRLMNPPLSSACSKIPPTNTSSESLPVSTVRRSVGSWSSTARRTGMGLDIQPVPFQTPIERAAVSAMAAVSGSHTTSLSPVSQTDCESPLIGSTIQPGSALFPSTSNPSTLRRTAASDIVEASQAASAVSAAAIEDAVVHRLTAAYFQPGAAPHVPFATPVGKAVRYDAAEPTLWESSSMDDDDESADEAKDPLHTKGCSGTPGHHSPPPGTELLEVLKAVQKIRIGGSRRGVPQPKPAATLEKKRLRWSFCLDEFSEEDSEDSVESEDEEVHDKKRENKTQKRATPASSSPSKTETKTMRRAAKRAKKVAKKKQRTANKLQHRRAEGGRVQEDASSSSTSNSSSSSSSSSDEDVEDDDEESLLISSSSSSSEGERELYTAVYDAATQHRYYDYSIPVELLVVEHLPKWKAVPAHGDSHRQDAKPHPKAEERRPAEEIDKVEGRKRVDVLEDRTEVSATSATREEEEMRGSDDDENAGNDAEWRRMAVSPDSDSVAPLFPANSSRMHEESGVVSSSSAAHQSPVGRKRGWTSLQTVKEESTAQAKKPTESSPLAVHHSTDKKKRDTEGLQIVGAGLPAPPRGALPKRERMLPPPPLPRRKESAPLPPPPQLQPAPQPKRWELVEPSTGALRLPLRHLRPRTRLSGLLWRTRQAIQQQRDVHRDEREALAAEQQPRSLPSSAPTTDDRPLWLQFLEDVKDVKTTSPFALSVVKDPRTPQNFSASLCGRLHYCDAEALGIVPLTEEKDWIDCLRAHNQLQQQKEPKEMRLFYLVGEEEHTSDEETPSQSSSTTASDDEKKK